MPFKQHLLVVLGGLVLGLVFLAGSGSNSSQGQAMFKVFKCTLASLLPLQPACGGPSWLVTNSYSAAAETIDSS